MKYATDNEPNKLILPSRFSVGSAVPLFYGLNFRDSTLMIIFFNLLFCIPASYIVTIAPLTGMRQMIQSRYVFGSV